MRHQIFAQTISFATTPSLRLQLQRLMQPLMLACAILIALSTAATAEIRGTGLSAVHQWTALRYGSVKHMPPAKLAELQLSDASRLLILDIREPEEFAVSHLHGAIRVSPSIDEADFMRRFGGNLKGRILVLYCSVGARSTDLAARIGQASKTAGAKSVYNLEGGIFNWHNQSRQLVNARGATDYVHPFDATWGKLLIHRSLSRYHPLYKSQGQQK